MEIDDFVSNLKLGNAEGEDEEKQRKGKALVVIMVGPPGSGKSTFCDLVMASSSRSWVRICQDNINKGKSGTKAHCISSAIVALKDNRSVFIDRCNLDRERRAEFVKLGSPEVDVHAVVLDLPAKLCISRSIKRTGHEGNLQGGKAAAVVNRMLQNKELPKLNEGFTRITICQSENDVKDAIATYSKLNTQDTLPSGCFGQKSPDAKVQPGILKFFKKVNPPSSSGASEIQSSLQSPSVKETPALDKGSEPNFLDCANCEGEKRDHMIEDSVTLTPALMTSTNNSASFDTAATLAFPSISTAYFQFDHEKASDIIVEKVEEYISKLKNARLVLVDLSPKSKILSLVKAKSAKRNVDPEKFFTFVGDITCLYSKGGLRCNVIANAANWRLKPGGGGVNAAIFSAAGPSLEVATKERANTLAPGNALVVPIPSDSALFIQEGITHVIHVLGPNMNPQRPNYLKNNYEEGCKILRNAYSSLFKGFESILEDQSADFKKDNGESCLKKSKLWDQSVKRDENASEQKLKRDNLCTEERSKKYKGQKYDVGLGNTGLENRMEQEDKTKGKLGTSKTWSSWALALYNIAVNPEKHMKDVLEITADVVVLNDAYPKAKRHILVLARLDGLDGLGDVCQDHLKLLSTMQKVGMKWVEKFLIEDESLIFRLGFHSNYVVVRIRLAPSINRCKEMLDLFYLWPLILRLLAKMLMEVLADFYKKWQHDDFLVTSMRQLHLHVISQDFNSQYLKHKKHWNSFNTEFFRDAIDVINEVESFGKASIQDEGILAKELRCHRCRSAHPNIPRLKSHINDCQASFPAILLEKGCLVQGPNRTKLNS